MLQYMAMFTMLVDHVGVIFFPEVESLRIIGRIAFPLYCWFVVQGYRNTSSLRKYVRRLLLIAFLAQIPYTLALQAWELNVIFTLTLALICLYVLDLKIEELFKFWFVVLVSLLSIAIPMDYGLYGILLVIIYRYYDGWRMAGYHLFLNSFFFLVYGFGYWIQFFSLLGTLMIIYRRMFISLPSNKWIYRSFYPAHLVLLYIIYLLFSVT